MVPSKWLQAVIFPIPKNSQNNPKIYTKLFDNCVVPVLHYCAGVWGLQSHQVLQNIQNMAMRFYLCTHKLAPTGLVGDLGWYSLSLFRKLSAVRLWNRFIKMSDNRIAKKVFTSDWQLYNKNWSSEFKQVQCIV